MSDKQINGYVNERLTPQAGDFMDVDADLGGGTYQSQKLKYSNLLANILANVTNIYKADGTLTATRTLNFGGYPLYLDGGKSPRLLGFGETDPDTAGNANYDALEFNALVPRLWVEKFVKKVTVTNWTEYQEGIATLQTLGGGILELEASFSVDSLTTLDHSNVVVNGNGYILDCSVNQLRISGNTSFDNVIFGGAQYNGINDTTNTLVLEQTSQFSRVVFQRCGFRGVLGGTINDDSVVSCTHATSPDFTVLFTNCQINDAYAQRVGYNERKLVITVPNGLLLLSVFNDNNPFTTPASFTTSQANTNYYKAITNDGTTFTSDGTAFIDSDIPTNCHTRSNGSGITLVGGNVSGSVQLHLVDIYDTYFYTLTGDTQLNIDKLYLAKGRKCNFVIDNAGGHALTITSSTYWGNLPQGTGTLVFTAECLNDETKTGNPAGVPNVIIY